MDSNPTLPLDFCPFQTKDESLFKIWGEWFGEDPDNEYDNKTGELFITIIFRNKSHLTMYEKKTEVVSVHFQKSNITLLNTPNSFWSFDPQTRRGIIFDTYAWMWVAPPDLRIGKNITIFNYQFRVTEQVGYYYNGTLRQTMRTIYTRNRTLSNEDHREIVYQLQYDLQSGHILYYYVSSNTFSSNGSLSTSEYYTIALNRTTIDLDKIYGIISSNRAILNTFILVSPLLFCVFFLVTYFIWKKRL
jgi:hypothetical protein